MIHYQLRCGQDHEFDGWFSGSSGFEQQAERHLIECPFCGSTDVTRALMAPAVATRDAPVPTPPVPTQQSTQQVLPPSPSGMPAGPMPARLIALLHGILRLCLCPARVTSHCHHRPAKTQCCRNQQAPQCAVGTPSHVHFPYLRITPILNPRPNQHF